jgi:hypothetical protein
VIFYGARDLLETTGAITPPRRHRHPARLRFAGVLLLYAAGWAGFLLLILTLGMVAQ